MTHWTEHIKDFASKQGLSYKDAMKHPECSASYKKGGAVGAYLGKDGEVKVVAKQGKGRGRPKKQTSKDREDEKLAMEIHNLKGEGLRGTTPQVLLENSTPPVANMMVRRGRGRRPVAEAVQDIAGNWIIPPIETFNEMLSMKENHPSHQSAPRIAKKHRELATNISNIEKDLFHTPATPAPTKKGRGRPKGSKNQIIQLADAPFISAETDNLGLGANAGKHYIINMNNIIWETTLYENSDVNVGQMEIQFCCKCREEIVKECYTIERMNRKPFWRRKENYHIKCYTEKDAEIRLSKRQPDLVIMKGGDREEIYLNELPKIKIGDTMPSSLQHFS